MDRRDYKAELDEMLEATGGFYKFEDIIDHIDRGLMQSFAVNNTWVVTQVNEFPRKKVLEVVFVVGDMIDLHAIEAQLEIFREQIGADLMSATGRMGFMKAHKNFDKWKPVSVNFVRV